MVRLVSAVLLTTVFHASALACAYRELADVPLMPAGATLLDEGGVLMTIEYSGDSEDGGGLSLTSDGVPVEVTLEQLAPALSLLRPKQATARKLDLVGSRGAIVRSFKQSTGGKRLPAPTGKVTSTLSRNAVVQSRTPISAAMTITLAQDPPKDAAVLVVFEGTGADREGRAWTVPVRGQRTYTFSQGGKQCSPGPIVVRQGARITLAYFDIHGRESRAAAVAVAAKR